MKEIKMKIKTFSCNSAALTRRLTVTHGAEAGGRQDRCRSEGPRAQHHPVLNRRNQTLWVAWVTVVSYTNPPDTPCVTFAQFKIKQILGRKY